MNKDDLLITYFCWDNVIYTNRITWKCNQRVVHFIMSLFLIAHIKVLKEMKTKNTPKKNVCVIYMCIFCVYIYIYMCVCVCVCVCVSISIYLSISIYIYIYMYLALSLAVGRCIFQSELILSAGLILSDRVFDNLSIPWTSTNLPLISAICLWFRKTCRRVKIRAKIIQCELGIKGILCSSINVMLILIFSL